MYGSHTKANEFPVFVDDKILVLIQESCDTSSIELKKSAFIKVKNPRLAFAKVVSTFFIERLNFTVCSSSVIDKTSIIHEKVKIGSNCVIGRNVEIGENTVINNSVVIGDNTRIGKNCYLKSGSIIGEDGFGFDFEENGMPVRMPHLGRVIIGNNVEIGAKNTIARGTLDDTVIDDYVKTDDQIHIAHNCKIGKNTIITACAEISGSVEIGSNCWIAPNCTIINKVKIGNNVTVGIGALIIEDIPDNCKYMGLEALELKTLRKLKRKLEYGSKF